MTGPYRQPDPLEQILPLLQFLEQRRRTNVEQADALINRLPGQGAGMTIQQSGLTPKQIKAKYGKNITGNELIAPETVENKSNTELLKAINAMSPDELEGFGASLVSRQMGVPQVTTRKGLASQRQASEIGAANQVTEEKTKGAALDEKSRLVMEGIAGLQKAGAETRTRMGQALSGLGSPEASDLAASQTNLQAVTTKMALEALADPKHPLNTAMKSTLGFNAITAAPAIAMGMGNLADAMAQIAHAKITGNTQIAVAKIQAELDRDKEFNAAEARWAEGVAKNLGGKVSPTVVANWRRWTDAGRPGKAPQGVTPELDATLKTSSDIATQAFINDQAQKGDSDAKMILQLAEMVAKVPNKNTAEAISELMAKYYGRVAATKTLGPRPADGPEATAWDNTAAFMSKRFDKVSSKNMWLGGGVKVNPGNPLVPQGGGIAPPTGVVPGTLPMSGGNREQPFGVVPPNTPGGPGAELSPQDAAMLNMLNQALNPPKPPTVTPPTP